jgi:hypothetical protein
MRFIAESFGVFAATLVVVFLMYFLPMVNSHRAYGLAWFASRGFLLINVGIIYVICGIVVVLKFR